MLKISVVVKSVGLCSALVLGGCSTYSLPGGEPVPVEEAPDYEPVAPPPTTATPEVAPREPANSSAYGGLVSKADQASARGDYDQALALLERAQRIDPDSAEIYLSLAATYTAKGDQQLASATAERGMLYCQGRKQCDALRAYTR